MCHLRRMRNVRVYHLTARLAQDNIVHADTKTPFNWKRVKSESICRISFQSTYPLNNLLKFIPTKNSVAFFVRHDETQSSWYQTGILPTLQILDVAT